MIEPRLEFARYISPAEIGVSKEFINSKMAEYRGSFGHLPPDL